ncbi:MAG: DNA-binding domain-containing protein [Gallionella sp.]
MLALNDELSDFARSIVRGEELSPQINADYPKYSAAVAIEVYRNNYRGNLHDALVGAYPVIEQLVGRDFFWHLTRKFIEQHTSSSGNLHRYGKQMAAFIVTFAPAQQLVYLSDVARLEWVYHCAYYAPDAAMLDISKLSQLSSDQYPHLILLSHPACHVVRSGYPIASIWQAHQPGAPGDFHIDLDSGLSLVLVIRKDDMVQVRELAEADAEWLSAIQAGITLGNATTLTLERYPDFDLQATLTNMVSLGAFVDFNLGGMP